MDSKHDGSGGVLCANAEAEIARLNAEVRGLREALGDYGQHKGECAVWKRTDAQMMAVEWPACTCGLAKAEAARVMEGTPCPECAGTGKVEVAGESGVNGELTTTGPCPRCKERR